MYQLCVAYFIFLVLLHCSEHLVVLLPQGHTLTPAPNLGFYFSLLCLFLFIQGLFLYLLWHFYILMWRLLSFRSGTHSRVYLITIVCFHLHIWCLQTEIFTFETSNVPYLFEIITFSNRCRIASSYCSLVVLSSSRLGSPIWTLALGEKPAVPVSLIWFQDRTDIFSHCHFLLLSAICELYKKDWRLSGV